MFSQLTCKALNPKTARPRTKSQQL